VVGHSEYGNEPSGSVQGENSFDLLRNCWHLRRDSAARNNTVLKNCSEE